MIFKPVRRAEVEFEFIDDIGEEGKNSEVYLAEDPQLDSEIVIKEIDKNKIEPDNYFSESAKLYLSSHPNVVQVLYACQDNDKIYSTMPYYEDGSLKNKIESRFLTVREIIKHSIVFLSGLRNIHSKKLVHFDIKPDNVMLNHSGEALLSDFGLAKFMDPDWMAEQALSYTKMRPPEVYVGDNYYTVTYDIYQAGLTLYRMCFGDEEFYRQFNQYVNGLMFDEGAFVDDLVRGNFPNRETRNFLPHIPIPLKRIVRKCLEVNPDDRYQSVHDLINDLSKIGGEVLDWQREENDDHFLYRKVNDRGEFYIKVFENGQSEAKKNVGDNNDNFRRITDFCSDDINYQQIQRFLNETG